jgi:hypothetical protein
MSTKQLAAVKYSRNANACEFRLQKPKAAGSGKKTGKKKARNNEPAPLKPSRFETISANVPEDINAMCDELATLSEAAMENAKFGHPFAQGVSSKVIAVGRLPP